MRHTEGFGLVLLLLVDLIILSSGSYEGYQLIYLCFLVRKFVDLVGK